MPRNKNNVYFYKKSIAPITNAIALKCLHKMMKKMEIIALDTCPTELSHFV